MKKVMKKSLFPALIVLSVSLVFTGCTDDSDKPEDSSVEVKVEDAKDKTDDVIKDTEDKVRDVNYQDIKITADQAFDKFMELHPNAKINKIDLDKELTDYNYIVEGYDAENGYEVKINPVDGSIISNDKEVIKTGDENGEITKNHLAKVDSIIEKAKKEDGSNSELDEWNISVDDGKVIMHIEIGLMKYSYDMESEALTNKEETKKENEGNGFTDIDNENDETKEAINNLVSKGIIAGVSDTEFKPNDLMTRTDVAVVMVNGLYEVDKDAKASFTDVKEDDKYYADIATSEKENIVMGYPNDLFKGSDNITREDFISIASRALHEKKQSVYPDNSDEVIKLSDKDKVSDYAVKEVALAANEGLIDNTDSKLDPQGKITRSEAAVIINRLVGKL